MFNKVTLVGRIATDLMMSTTEKGKEFVRFNLALRVTDGKAQFVPITAGELSAINLCKYMKKGSKILVEGRLNCREVEKPDGTKVKYTGVVSNRVVFLDPIKLDLENE